MLHQAWLAEERLHETFLIMIMSNYKTGYWWECHKTVKLSSMMLYLALLIVDPTKVKIIVPVW